MKIRILFLVTLLCTAIASLQNADAATITVTNTNDSGAGSLRQALADANDGDIVNFSVTGTITLTGGQLVIGKSVTISGPGAANLAVDGNHASPVSYVNSGKTVTISGLTITNGVTLGAGGGIYNDHGSLTVSNCTVSGNSASNGGGAGILNNGSVSGSAALTVNNSTLSGNLAAFGGGIGNIGSSGGSAALTVNNTTLTGNSATDGGGIYNGGSSGSATLTVNNSTLSGNSATDGGGIVNDGRFSGRAILTISNTILNAGNSGGTISNNSGMVSSAGYNLSSDDGGGYLTATGDQINTDPKLGPLQDNGGPTFTHLPLTGSPAIDGGDPALTFDQRGPGFLRVVNGRVDIGAVEVQTASVPAAPTATAATNVTSNSFTANWNSVYGATGYRLDVATSSSFKGGSFVSGFHNLNVGNVTNVNVTGLSANTTYYYRVRAFNSSGASPYSNVITVTTSP